MYDAKMKISVIIPSAGKSTRYGKKDKLAEDLGGRPLLIRTVEFFTKREEVTQIIVVGPSHDFENFRERFAPSLSFHGVLIVEGGATRCDSVKNALEAVEEGIDRIAVHDGARPALTNELFDKIIQAAKKLHAVAAATQITGTLKRIKKTKQTISDDDAIADSIFGGEGKFSVDVFEVEQTVDRHGLWELQTPQIFEPSLLKRAYNRIDCSEVTDDAQLVEELGEVVHLVQGESRNIKVTTQSDLALVKALLGVKAPQGRSSHYRF